MTLFGSENMCLMSRGSFIFAVPVLSTWKLCKQGARNINFAKENTHIKRAFHLQKYDDARWLIITYNDELICCI